MVSNLRIYATSEGYTVTEASHGDGILFSYANALDLELVLVLRAYVI